MYIMNFSTSEDASDKVDPSASVQREEVQQGNEGEDIQEREESCDLENVKIEEVCIA